MDTRLKLLESHVRHLQIVVFVMSAVSLVTALFAIPFMFGVYTLASLKVGRLTVVDRDGSSRIILAGRGESLLLMRSNKDTSAMIKAASYGVEATLEGERVQLTAGESRQPPRILLGTNPHSAACEIHNSDGTLKYRFLAD